MPPFLPTDPTLQLLLHALGLALGWYLRHKGVSLPMLPAPVNAPAAPAAPAEDATADVVHRILREELLPLLRRSAAEAVTEALANAKKD